MPRTALTLSRLMLIDLLAWLEKKGIATGKIRLVHDESCDRMNQRTGRAMCFTVRGSDDIHAARALDFLAFSEPTAACGVLLHEVAHILSDSFGPDAEVNTDVWIVQHARESGYGYRSVVYKDRERNVFRTASNIESVSAGFLKTISKKER